MDNYRKETWCIQSVLYLVIKKNKLMSFAGKWKKTGALKLGEISD